MKWTVIDTIACPNTGIAFSSLVSLKMFKLVIWYESSVLFPPGATVEPYRNGVVINGKYYPLITYNITTYNREAWQNMKNKIICSETMGNDSEYCLSPFSCALKICPHGKKQVTSVGKPD
ncbi:anti-adapter protein IraM [Enterobacter cloacae complex sp. I2]|uniref:anti-adapter protein IraM n=1 Tax=Enterobacter cloacae complex sp. I2 TaxID=2779603 RepID=UPI001867D21D|nr:anti-adapter protein IraM [Enterobacter cloacae complex sp. I2]